MANKPEWVRIKMHPATELEMPTIVGLLAQETDRLLILAQYVTHWVEDDINGEFVEVPQFSDPDKDPIRMLNKDYVVEIQVLKTKPGPGPLY